MRKRKHTRRRSKSRGGAREIEGRGWLRPNGPASRAGLRQRLIEMAHEIILGWAKNAPTKMQTAQSQTNKKKWELLNDTFKLNGPGSNQLHEMVVLLVDKIVHELGGQMRIYQIHNIILSPDWKELNTTSTVIKKLANNPTLAIDIMSKAYTKFPPSGGSGDGGASVAAAQQMPEAPSAAPTVASSQAAAAEQVSTRVAVADAPRFNGGGRKRRQTRRRRKKRGGAPRLGHKLATPAELNADGITWADGTHAEVYIAPRDITSDGKHKVVSVGFALAIEKKLSDLAAAINDCHPVGCRRRDKEATAIQAVHRGSMLRKHPPEVLRIHQQFKPGGSGMVEASSRWDSTVGKKRKRSKGGRRTRRRRRKRKHKKKSRRRR